MSHNTRIAVALAALMLAPAELALAQQAALPGVQSEAKEARIHVTYITPASVYVDAGTEDGIAVGAKLQVVREGHVVAVLTVTDVAAHRAACSSSAPTSDLKVGDLVEPAPKAAPEAKKAPATQKAPAAGKAAPTPTPRARHRGLRGRVGVNYLAVWQRDRVGQDFSQPMLTLRLDGNQIGGAPVDLTVDARARRTSITLAGGESFTKSLNRVYQLNASWRTGPLRLTFGRQFSPSLSSVSVFDGMNAEYRPGRLGGGVFVGTQPDPIQYQLSSKIREFGGYVDYSAELGSPHRWGATVGIIGSYQDGDINREFVFLQGRYNGPKVSGFAQQEVDVNRGWRKKAEGSTFTSTSSFVLVRVRPIETFSFDGGFDNRRNVRVFRDKVTPETQFDDAYRQGEWLGVEWRPAHRYLVGANARRSTGGVAGTADSYTANLGVYNLTPLRLDIHERSTHYSSDRLQGWLHSASAGLGLVGGRLRVDAHGGIRRETDRTRFGGNRSLSWYGIDLDVVCTRRLFYLLSVDRNTGENESNDQLYTGLSWRL